MSDARELRPGSQGRRRGEQAPLHTQRQLLGRQGGWEEGCGAPASWAQKGRARSRSPLCPAPGLPGAEPYSALSLGHCSLPVLSDLQEFAQLLRGREAPGLLLLPFIQ